MSRKLAALEQKGPTLRGGPFLFEEPGPVKASQA